MSGFFGRARDFFVHGERFFGGARDFFVHGERFFWDGESFFRTRWAVFLGWREFF